MSLETSSLLSNAFGTSGFSWDSAKPRALTCRTCCQCIPDYGCAMSPTNPETMTKGVVFPLQSSRVKGRDVDLVGQILPLVGNPGTPGSPQRCSHLTTSHHTTLSPAPCRTQETDGQPAGSCLSMQRSLAWDPNQTPQEEGLQNLAGGMQSGAPVSEGSNSFNAGWPREGLLQDRQTHLELF